MTPSGLGNDERGKRCLRNNKIWNLYSPRASVLMNGEAWTVNIQIMEISPAVLAAKKIDGLHFNIEITNNGSLYRWHRGQAD